MPRKCQLSGKAPLTGNNVSHANNKTKRRFLPNLQVKRFKLKDGRSIKLKVSTRVLRNIDKMGGIDAYLTRFPLVLNDNK